MVNVSYFDRISSACSTVPTSLVTPFSNLSIESQRRDSSYDAKRQAAQPPAPREGESPVTTGKIQAILQATLPQFPAEVVQLIHDYLSTPSKIQLLANRLSYNEHSFILYDLPDTKPDPAAPCTLDVLRNDNRPRVLQASTKGAGTCSYYAMNLVRQRIGKNPVPELAEARRREQLCSWRRKQISKHDASLPLLIRVNERPDLKLAWQQEDKQFAQAMLQKWAVDGGPSMDREAVQQGRPSLRPMLQDFVNQKEHRDYFSYTQWRKLGPRLWINIAFLQKAGYTVERLFETMGVSPAPVREWSKLNYKRDGKCVDRCAMVASAELYDLEASMWRPHIQLEGLIHELKRLGPLAVLGFFGHDCYRVEARKTGEKIEGNSIYGRPPGTRKKHYAGHSVTVVGAKGADFKGYVYYVDAYDPPTYGSRKIYKISYTSFTTHIREFKPKVFAWGAKNFLLRDVPFESKTAACATSRS